MPETLPTSTEQDAETPTLDAETEDRQEEPSSGTPETVEELRARLQKVEEEKAELGKRFNESRQSGAQNHQKWEQTHQELQQLRQQLQQQMQPQQQPEENLDAFGLRPEERQSLREARKNFDEDTADALLEKGARRLQQQAAQRDQWAAVAGAALAQQAMQAQQAQQGMAKRLANLDLNDEDLVGRALQLQNAGMWDFSQDIQQGNYRDTPQGQISVNALLAADTVRGKASNPPKLKGDPVAGASKPAPSAPSNWRNKLTVEERQMLDQSNRLGSGVKLSAEKFYAKLHPEEYAKLKG